MINEVPKNILNNLKIHDVLITQNSGLFTFASHKILNVYPNNGVQVGTVSPPRGLLRQHIGGTSFHSSKWCFTDRQESDSRRVSHVSRLKEKVWPVTRLCSLIDGRQSDRTPWIPCPRFCCWRRFVWAELRSTLVWRYGFVNMGWMLVCMLNH